MQGLIEEGEELIEEEVGEAALICAAQKVEHYEIAACGSLQSWACLLDEPEAAKFLQQILSEEKATDQNSTKLPRLRSTPRKAKKNTPNSNPFSAGPSSVGAALPSSTDPRPQGTPIGALPGRLG